MLSIMDEMWMKEILVADQTRLMQYQKAWNAYFGQWKKPLRVKQGQPDDNVIVNFVRIIVDVAVAKLFGEEVHFEADELRETPGERYLDEVWRRNQKMIFLQKAALNGAVTGHVFIKIVPRPDFPKLINLSPEYVHVVTDPDDISDVRRYVIQYPAIGVNGERIVKRQIIEKNESGKSWQVRDMEARGDGPFRPLNGADGEVWPHPWPPIVDCQNLPSPNEYYGRADVEDDVIRLNESINFVLSNMSRIIRYHAHPKTWGSGFAKRNIDMSVDNLIILPAGAQLHNLEMQSDLGSSLALYARLKESLHEITRTPEVALGKMDSVGALSGVALQILYGPLVEKTAAKRLTYGEMLRELNRRLLALGGFPEVDVHVHWPDILPKDSEAARKNALIDQQLGVSQDTLLQKLGYDPELERQKREENTQNMAETMLQAFNTGK